MDPRQDRSLSGLTPSSRRNVLGLRAQILLGLISLVLLAASLIAVAAVHTTTRNVEQMNTERSEGAVRSLRALLAHVPAEQRAQAIADFVALGDVSAACALGPDGQWIPDPCPLAAHAPRGEGTRGPRIADVDGRARMIARSGEAQGDTVLVSMALDDARSRVARAREIIWVYITLNAVFVFALGYALLTFMVVRPIRSIGVATERAAAGDLANPITTLPRNEFGQVGRSFNVMLTTLETQRRDLTRQLKQLAHANQELVRTQSSLLRSEKLASVGHLAAGVAHEVGNPLAAVAGYVEYLEDDDLTPEERQDVLARMQRQLERIQHIVRELLDFSRDDSEHPLTQVALHKSVAETMDLVRATPRGKRTTLLCELPEDLPAVLAVSSHITQVLLNVLLNACDAMAAADTANPRVHITAEERDEHVTLLVQDYGPGLDADTASKIFEPFFTTKDVGSGTGLGLPVALKVMERMGGTLEVRDSEHGACFALVFRRA